MEFVGRGGRESWVVVVAGTLIVSINGRTAHISVDATIS